MCEVQAFLDGATPEKLQEFKEWVRDQAHAPYLAFLNAIQAFKYTENEQERIQKGSEIWKKYIQLPSNFAQILRVETQIAIQNEPLPPRLDMFRDAQDALLPTLQQDYKLFRARGVGQLHTSSSSFIGDDDDDDDAYYTTQEAQIRKAPSKGERKGSEVHGCAPKIGHVSHHAGWQSEGGLPYQRIVSIYLTLENRRERFYTGAKVHCGAFAKAIIQGKYCAHTHFDPTACYRIYVESCMEDRSYNNRWLEDDQPLETYENILGSIHTIARPRVSRNRNA